MGIDIIFTEEAKAFITDRGYDPNFGARPLRRALQNLVEDPLAEELLKGRFGTGSHVLVQMNEANDAIEFTEAHMEPLPPEITNAITAPQEDNTVPDKDVAQHTEEGPVDS